MEQASNGQLPLTNYQLRARRDKSRYLEEIRLNWGADIEDRIPASIHPRKTLTPHRKPRVGDIAEIEDDPRNWSLELLRLLRNLSRKQVASLATMQDLVETEVRLRQSSTTTNKYKLAAEVIIDDVQRVIDGIDKRHASDETERKYEEMGTQQPATATDQQNIKLEVVEDHFQFALPVSPAYSAPSGSRTNRFHLAPPSYPCYPTPSGSTGNQAHFNPQSADAERVSAVRTRIVERRAAALRLRADAARWDAKALDLEADADELWISKKRRVG